MAEVEVETCVGPAVLGTCSERAERNVEGVGPLCQGHRKQHLRGRRLTPLQPKSARERLKLLLDALEDALHRLEDAKADARAELEARGSAYANADSENDHAFKKAQRDFYEAVEAYGRARFRSRRRR
jgi:hypothetical protein